MRDIVLDFRAFVHVGVHFLAKVHDVKAIAEEWICGVLVTIFQLFFLKTSVFGWFEDVKKGVLQAYHCRYHRWSSCFW